VRFAGLVPLGIVALSTVAGSQRPTSSGSSSGNIELAVTIHPIRSGGPEVTSVEVRTEIRGAIDSTRRFSAESPIVYAGRTGIADRVDGLVIRDSNGDVPVTTHDDPVNRGGFPYYRHWRANRAVAPPVTVSYRMKSFVGTATVGPQFDFYSHSGGISSGGMALLAIPESLGVALSRVHWDLSDLAPASTAATTYGEGDFELRAPPEQLMQAYYMAGPLGHHAPPDATPTTGFHAYWLGTPVFEPRREMAWTYQSYQYLRKFWGDSAARTYRVFLRALPGTGGGTALQNSFMAGTPPGNGDSTQLGPRATLTHEMDHMFVGQLSGGNASGGTTWFNEGLNVYYTRLLLLRSGLVPVSEYERDLNASARGYYSNPFRNASADSLARVGFSSGIGGGSAQNVAYTRGSLYFADVDAKIRAASDGRRKLDDIILPLVERRRRGARIDQAALVDALVKELGPAAREQFEAVIIRGETINPAAGAFGSCFERRAAKFTAGGGEVDGFEWVRVPSIPDEQCRAW
jgi:hypothetical protein